MWILDLVFIDIAFRGLSKKRDQIRHDQIPNASFDNYEGDQAAMHRSSGKVAGVYYIGWF